MNNDYMLASWAIGSVWCLMVSMIVLNSLMPRGDK